MKRTYPESYRLTSSISSTFYSWKWESSQVALLTNVSLLLIITAGLGWGTAEELFLAVHSETKYSSEFKVLKLPLYIPQVFQGRRMSNKLLDGHLTSRDV